MFSTLKARISLILPQAPQSTHWYQAALFPVRYFPMRDVCVCVRVCVRVCGCRKYTLYFNQKWYNRHMLLPLPGIVTCSRLIVPCPVFS